MTPADASDVLLATLAAVVVTRPRARPVALVLLAGLATDAAQRALALAYAGTPRPYVGAARVAFTVAQACHLAWAPLVLSWSTLALGRRAPAAPLYAVACVSAAALYPWPSPLAPSPVYAVTQAACVAVEVCAVVGWARRGGERTQLAAVALALTSGELAVLVSPYLGAYALGSDPRASWALAMPARCITWLAVGVIVCLPWSGGCCPRSPSSAPSWWARSRGWARSCVRTGSDSPRMSERAGDAIDG